LDFFVYRGFSFRACARGAIVGGSWNNGAQAGRFTLNLNNTPSNTNNNIGARCGLPEVDSARFIRASRSDAVPYHRRTEESKAHLNRSSRNP
jgi:hypothetical protein